MFGSMDIVVELLDQAESGRVLRSSLSYLFQSLPLSLPISLSRVPLLDRVDTVLSRVLVTLFTAIRRLVIQVDKSRQAQGESDELAGVELVLDKMQFIGTKELDEVRQLVQLIGPLCRGMDTVQIDRIKREIERVAQALDRLARQNFHALRTQQNTESQLKSLLAVMECLNSSRETSTSLSTLEMPEDVLPEHYNLFNTVQATLSTLHTLNSSAESNIRTIRWLEKENRRLNADLCSTSPSRQLELELARCKLHIAQLESDKDDLELELLNMSSSRNLIH